MLRKRLLLLLLGIAVLLNVVASQVTAQTNVTSGATTSVHLVKYANDGSTILAEKTVSYKWMEDNLPVQGDGVTHYYHQGPVFDGDMWDPGETANLKDKGAVMGTDVKDLCDLVGGMSPGDEIMICAVDGYSEKFAYSNVYEPLHRQGPIALCWFKGKDTEANGSYGAGYPGNDAYSDAMQIVFLARNTNVDGRHVFGNSDMKVCLPEDKYQHFYEGYPSTNGMTGKWINEIRIYPAGTSVGAVKESARANISGTSKHSPWVPLVLGVVGLIAVSLGIYLLLARKEISADQTQQ
jgi:hypothetical protein